MSVRAQTQLVTKGDPRAFGKHLTFKGNRKDTRYGWLRLTPAYSLTLVDELLDNLRADGRVLDPFCGTGTTALLCGEREIDSVTTDINPFLIWLTKMKTARYKKADLDEFGKRADDALNAIGSVDAPDEWLPPLHQIDKWWDSATLHGLGRAMATTKSTDTGGLADDLLRIVFCRAAITTAAVSFGHQSMSFKRQTDGTTPLGFDDQIVRLQEIWREGAASIRSAAEATDIRTPTRALLLDARNLTDEIDPESVARVITSPPYPNRMSYIRELRPYLYWLGYIGDAKEAGELDWTAIGGTWGTATSRVGKWQPTDDRIVPYQAFGTMLDEVARNGSNGPLLSRYIHKYFFDMVAHVDELYSVMEPGAQAFYIVGNSKFYGTMVPVQEIYAGMFGARGFVDINVRPFRKRSSKKELFEYVVEARRP
jgi:hypothetical protein